MATQLIKPITREPLAVTDQAGRKIIVTMEPGDIISFRPKGKRTTYSVPLQAVYFLALISTVRARHKDRMERYKLKKKNGERVRKPKPLPRIFSPVLYEALRLN